MKETTKFESYYAIWDEVKFSPDEPLDFPYSGTVVLVSFSDRKVYYDILYNNKIYRKIPSHFLFYPEDVKV